jgi:lipid-A-disaccharide synthase
MTAADLVLLASGTAALESALLGKPTVAAYRVAWLTFQIIKVFNLVKVDRVTLPNLLTGETLIPEFIQDEATPSAISAEVISLLNDRERRDVIRSRFAKLHDELALDANERAADALTRLVEAGPVGQ